MSKTTNISRTQQSLQDAGEARAALHQLAESLGDALWRQIKQGYYSETWIEDSGDSLKTKLIDCANDFASLKKEATAIKKLMTKAKNGDPEASALFASKTYQHCQRVANKLLQLQHDAASPEFARFHYVQAGKEAESKIDIEASLTQLENIRLQAVRALNYPKEFNVTSKQIDDTRSGLTQAMESRQALIVALQSALDEGIDAFCASHKHQYFDDINETLKHTAQTICDDLRTRDTLITQRIAEANTRAEMLLILQLEEQHLNQFIRSIKDEDGLPTLIGQLEIFTPGRPTADEPLSKESLEVLKLQQEFREFLSGAVDNNNKEINAGLKSLTSLRSQHI